MVKSCNNSLSFDDLDKMIEEMEQRREFTCTANDGGSCPSGACLRFGEVCGINLS